MNEIAEELFEIEEEEIEETEGADYYFKLYNAFLTHLSTASAEVLSSEYAIIPSSVPNSIMQTTASCYNCGSYALPINVPTLEIRKYLGVNTEEFPFAELISGRQSILFTSRSLQQRVEFREQFAMAAAGFLAQHFLQKQEIAYYKVMNRARSMRGIAEIPLTEGIYTYANPGVLVITPTAHQAWRINQAILGCIPSLLETNIRGRHKLAKYAPTEDYETFRCGDMALLADEIPDAYSAKINFYKCHAYYASKLGNYSTEFFFGFAFFRQVHRIEMMSRIRKSDILYGSIEKILEYGKYGYPEQDFSFLSGVHTVYIEDLDRIAVRDITKLKTVLAFIARRPAMIQNVDITALTQNCRQFSAVRSVQFVCSQRSENEYANQLFSAKLSNQPFDVPRETIAAEHNNAQEQKAAEFAFLQEGNCARNQAGLIKLNAQFSQSIFDGLPIKIMVYRIEEMQHIGMRRTDELPEGLLKFELAKHPKMDYLLNKELSSDQESVGIVLPDMIAFERFIHVVHALKMRVSQVPLNATKEDARKHIKRIKKGITRIFVTTEDEMQRSYHALPHFGKLVFYSPPRDYELFRFIIRHAPDSARIYWDEGDSFRWSNLVVDDQLAKILRNNVVLM